MKNKNLITNWGLPISINNKKDLFIIEIVYKKGLLKIILDNNMERVVVQWNANDIVLYRVFTDEDYSFDLYEIKKEDTKSYPFWLIKNSSLIEEIKSYIPEWLPERINIDKSKHYAILTLNECIDIIAMEEPQVKVRKINLWEKLKWKFIAFKEKKIRNL